MKIFSTKPLHMKIVEFGKGMCEETKEKGYNK
jgi:hypothetical protein